MPSYRIAWRSAKPRLPALATMALLVACTAGHADSASPAATLPDTTQQQLHPSVWRPHAFFAQFGSASEVTAATAGLIWNPRWDALPDPWSMYFEASLSRWNGRGDYSSDHGVLTQVALVPVFRWRADQGRSAWFGEGGIGATVTSSVYRHEDKHFSTSFNFGDHVGVGYSFGTARQNELALRFEHFSNAGIKHPNPGQNFTQLRYVHRFD